MAKSNAQRQKALRKRRLEQGHKRLTVWIDKHAQRDLEALKTMYPGISQDILVSNAIDAYRGR